MPIFHRKIWLQYLEFPILVESEWYERTASTKLTDGGKKVTNPTDDGTKFDRTIAILAKLADGDKKGNKTHRWGPKTHR